MNGKDALKKITEKENQDKMEILKNEVELIRSNLKNARMVVEASEKALAQAQSHLEKVEKDWENILKKEVSEVDLPKSRFPFLFSDWVSDPGPSCRCVSVPLQGENSIEKIGYAIEKIQTGELVSIENGIVSRCGN